MVSEVIQYLEVDVLLCRAQVRDNADDDSLRGLAVSMQTAGLLHPLRIRRDGDVLVVVDGERRLRAARLIGWKTIAVIVEEKELSASEIIARQLIANCQRKGLSPIEFARAIQELMESSGFNVSEAAAACGFSPATVSRHLKMLELPDDVQNKVATGQLPASTAYTIAKDVTPHKQSDAASEAVANGLTREQVRKKRPVRAPARRCRAAEKSQGNSPPRSVRRGRSITLPCPAFGSLAAFIGWLEQLLTKAQSQAADCDLSVFLKQLHIESGR